MTRCLRPSRRPRTWVGLSPFVSHASRASPLQASLGCRAHGVRPTFTRSRLTHYAMYPLGPTRARNILCSPWGSERTCDYEEGPCRSKGLRGFSGCGPQPGAAGPHVTSSCRREASSLSWAFRLWGPFLSWPWPSFPWGLWPSFLSWAWRRAATSLRRRRRKPRRQ